MRFSRGAKPFSFPFNNLEAEPVRTGSVHQSHCGDFCGDPALGRLDCGDFCGDFRPAQPLLRQGVNRPPLRLQSDVGVVLKHLRRDMAGKASDRLVTGGAALGKLSDEGMPGIVPAPPDARLLPD